VKSKGKGEEKEIAEIVHLMKPITRSPDSSSGSNNNSNNIIIIIIIIYYFLVFPCYCSSQRALKD
jgi:hypothetical protein